MHFKKKCNILYTHYLVKGAWLMSKNNQNPKDNEDNKEELAEVLRKLIDKIEIREIPKMPDDDNYDNALDDEEEDDDFGDEDYDDEECYNNELILDALYDQLDAVKGNVSAQYTGPDITNGLLGLNVLHNKTIAHLLFSLCIQNQNLLAQLSKAEDEKLELLKKQNELLMRILNK